MRIFRIISGLCVDLILFGMVIPWVVIQVGALIDKAFPVILHFDYLGFLIAGEVLIVLGALWLAWAWYLLVRVGHGYMTELFGVQISPVTDRLVMSGPFSFHRHPVSAGYLLILAGIGLVISSPGATTLCVPLLFALVYFYLRLFEEPALQKRFGHAYEIYSGQVPMFFPVRRNRIPVAVRNLQADRIRFTINVTGVAFSVLLICFQLSILKGTRTQITTYIDNVGADIWAMQKGVDDFVATSAVPRESADRIRDLKGVQKVAGIYAVYTLLEINHIKSRVYVIGYDIKSGDGGPWKLGKTLPHIKDARSLKEEQVLLDENLAQRHGLKPGDRVDLFGQSFTVAGYTLDTMSIGSQYVFLPRDTISRIMPGGVSAFTHILVWSDGTVSDQMIIRRIEKTTGLNSLTRDQFAANMRDFLGTFMLPLLTAGVVIGFLVGSITIGITLYTAVLERFKEYGTMKALGATDWFLYRIVWKQSFVSLIIGTAIGLALGVLANNIINEWVPGMTARLDGSIILQTILAGLAMALLSAGLPVWRLSRLDPMEAFRS